MKKNLSVKDFFFPDFFLAFRVGFFLKFVTKPNIWLITGLLTFLFVLGLDVFFPLAVKGFGERSPPFFFFLARLAVFLPCGFIGLLFCRFVLARDFLVMV